MFQKKSIVRQTVPFLIEAGIGHADFGKLGSFLRLQVHASDEPATLLGRVGNLWSVEKFEGSFFSLDLPTPSDNAIRRDISLLREPDLNKVWALLYGMGVTDAQSWMLDAPEGADHSYFILGYYTVNGMEKVLYADHYPAEKRLFLCTNFLNQWEDDDEVHVCRFHFVPDRLQ